MASTAELAIIIKARDDASRALSGIGDKAKAMESKLRPMGIAAGVALAGIGTAAIKMATDFESSMAEVWTLMPQMSEKAFGSLKKDVLGFSREMGIATDKVVPALYQAISAGVPPDNVLDFMETAAKASIGGVTELETAVDGLTSVVNAYGPAALSYAEASDIMFTGVRLGKTTFDELSASLYNVVPMAVAAGVSFEEVAAGLVALTAQGTPTAQATTQLRQALVSLAAPTQEQSKLAKELGLDFSAAHLAEVGLAGALKELYQVTGGNLETMRRMLGSQEAVNAAIVIGTSGAETYAAAMDEMTNSAGATDAAFKKVDETVARQFAKAINDIKVSLIEFGSAILPVVSKGIGVLSKALSFFMDHKALLVGAVTSLAAAFGAWAVTAGIAAAATIAAMAPVIGLAVAIGALGAVIYLVAKNWDTVWAALKAAPAGLYRWIRDNWVKALIALFIPGGFLFLAIKENWRKLFNVLPRPVQNFAVVVAGIFDRMGNSIIEMINWVIGKLNALAAEAKNIEKIWTWAGIPALPTIEIPTITGQLDIAGAMRAQMERGGPDLMGSWSKLLNGMIDRAREMGKEAGVGLGQEMAAAAGPGGAGGAAAEEAMSDLGERLSATFTEELLAGIEGLPPQVVAVISQAGEAIERFSAAFRPAVKEVFIDINELAVLGPDVPASYLAAQDAMDRLGTAMDFVSGVLKVQKDDLYFLGVELWEAQFVYDGLSAKVTHYSDQLDAARDALNRFANAQLLGSAAFDEAAFEIEQAIARIRLEMIKAEEAGATEEALQRFRDEMERLRREAEKLRLEEQLELDPLRRQIEQLLDPTKELTFEEIVRGIAETQGTIEDIEPVLAILEDLLAAQKEKLDDATDAHGAQQDTVKTTEELYNKLAGALGTLEGVMVSETRSALSQYRQLVYGSEVVKVYLNRLEDEINYGLQPALNGISTSHAVGQMHNLESAAKNAAAAVASIPGAGGVPGYQSGGIVPGPLGSPQLAVVHGGERITPAGGAGGAAGGTTIIHRENFGRQTFNFPQADPRKALKEMDRQFRGM